MPRPPRIQYENAFYHVMNRGRGRRWIFHGEAYYDAFLETLEEAHERHDARIHAYCLMGNHYHLLIETPLANLDRIMRHINGLYTQRYNRLKRTDGPLFRGRYKSILVDETAYLLQVSRYIHRNPIEIKGASLDALEKHRWSSYPAYINTAQAPNWLNRSLTYSMLGGKNYFAKYQAFVLRGIDTITAEFYGGESVTGVFGEKAFRQTVYDEREFHEIANGLPELIDHRPEMDEIVAVVAMEFGVSRVEVLQKRRGRQPMNIPRQVAIYCCQRRGGYTQQDVAECFSLTHRGSVSSAVKVIEGRIETTDLSERLDEIRRRLNFTKLT